MEQEIREAYEEWCEKAVNDPDLQPELIRMRDDEAAILDAFYRDLEFGTAGLRGIIGAGTNRMNVYTVGAATQGLAQYMNRHFEAEDRIAAISYDSRIKSELFAKTAAAVLAENGVKVFIFPELMPTPCLSFAVRALHAAAGIMVTASHNPAAYNGFKVYDESGCQMTEEAADEVYREIQALDFFSQISFGDFEQALLQETVSYMPESVYTDFIEAVKKQTVLPADFPLDRSASIIYTPLNGAGRGPVMRIFEESGYHHVKIIKEQEMPDGNFPTCTYPNPETMEAMALGMEYMKKYGADLLIATDPDSDRCAAAIRNGEAYQLLTGNEVACLLLYYILSARQRFGTLPDSPVFVKTIVSTDLTEKIAAKYGVETKNVLTGFKYIGEQIGLLEKAGREADYVFGFEESCGYLSGGYVRDKDAVDAAFLLLEMYSYYQHEGKQLAEVLEDIYREFGYTGNVSVSFGYEGISGSRKMAELMDRFRTEVREIAGRPILRKVDYADGVDGLPKANVIKFYLPGEASVIVRPSGTEPKIKVYISVTGNSDEDRKAQIDTFKAAIAPLMA